MRISHMAALADILLGDAETLARAYHEIAIARLGNFETEEARLRCAVAVNAVGMATDSAGYSAAYARITDLLGAAAKPGVVPVCKRCGSGDLLRDASAQWDSANQRWEISGVYDSTTCESCSAESNDLCAWLPRDPSPPLTKPVCRHCGSDRLVRDACARWDSQSHHWIFAGLQDCAFCKACEREGDDLFGDGLSPVPSAGEAP